MIKRCLPAVGAACLVFASTGESADPGRRIAVVVSTQDAPFTEAFRGSREYLRSRGVLVEYDEYQLAGDQDAAGPLIDRIRAGRPALVLTLGSLATESVLDRITDIPVVACMVMRLDRVKNAPNATGVGLEFPFDVQIASLRTVLPFVRNLGVLYNRTENGQRIASLRKSAAAAGIETVALEVKAPQDIPDALASLARSTDVVFGLADRVATSPPMAKPLLLFSFRQNIPLVGLSSTWVKAGALYALDWDFSDLGAQAGEMAYQVLQGTGPGQIPAAVPRTVRYSLNLRTARQLHIALPDSVVAGAWKTY